MIQVTAQTGSMVIDEQNLRGKNRQMSESVMPVATATPWSIIIPSAYLSEKALERLWNLSTA